MLDKNYITPQGYKRLQDELHQLFRIERPEIVKLVQWAASNGDRSENADYLYGKRRLREIDSRVRFLNKRIDAAIVVDPTQIQSDKVQFGATVTIVDENGFKKTYRIVGTDEINTAKNHVSWLSPIGKSLIGKSLNDSVTIKTPSQEFEVEIVQIEYKDIPVE
jgi:transcription elongation factor GreB